MSVIEVEVMMLEVMLVGDRGMDGGCGNDDDGGGGWVVVSVVVGNGSSAPARFACPGRNLWYGCCCTHNLFNLLFASHGLFLDFCEGKKHTK
jgi:hypothetical protein